MGYPWGVTIDPRPSPSWLGHGERISAAEPNGIGRTADAGEPVGDPDTTTGDSTGGAEGGDGAPWGRGHALSATTASVSRLGVASILASSVVSAARVRRAASGRAWLWCRRMSWA